MNDNPKPLNKVHFKINQLEQIYADEAKCASLVGLEYVTDTTPGFSRHQGRNGFIYKSQNGSVIKDHQTLDRIKKLSIPPAWDEVWICQSENGHLQTTGRDQKGRKQYQYHAKWREIRDILNTFRIIIFGECLPTIRERIQAEIRQKNLDHDKAVATVIAIMDKTFIRVGNETSARENHSYGLTTLEPKHVKLAADEIEFVFTGKSHKKHDIKIKDQHLVKILRAMEDLPGQHLFEYLIGEDVHAVNSDDINHYLKNISGHAISAKEFRTWGGTLSAFVFAEEYSKSNPNKDVPLTTMYKEAAFVLGNTPGMARDHYIHPYLIATIKDGSFTKHLARIKSKMTSPPHYVSQNEANLLIFLRDLLQSKFET